MDCLFCKIVAGEIPSEKVYEDQWCYGFKDIQPTAPIHYLFVPKEHMKDLSHSHGKEESLLKLLEGIRQFVQEQQLDKDGYRLVINAGTLGQQTVDHLHVHLLTGRQLTWPAG